MIQIFSMFIIIFSGSILSLMVVIYIINKVIHHRLEEWWHNFTDKLFTDE